MEPFGIIIILLIIVGILFLYMKKEQRVSERASNMMINSYQKNGFAEDGEDDKVLFFESLHIPEYLKENDFYIESNINNMKLFKNDDCKVIDLDFAKRDQKDRIAFRIGGSFYTKKLNFKVDKPLFFQFDIDKYVKYQKTDYELDYEINEDSNGDESSFENKCKELANEKYVDFMFYIENDVLEVYVDERIKQDKLDEFATISGLGMKDRVEYMTDYFIKIVDDIEYLLRDNLKISKGE